MSPIVETVEPKERLRRLKLCFYALEIGTVVCSFLDKIFTFIALTHHGAKEINPFASFLMNSIGLIPALIVGFFASILPLILIHYGIRKFRFDKELHYWIYVFFMTVYFTIFFKLIESQVLLFTS